VFMLRLTDEYKDADLVRTRDPAKRMPHSTRGDSN
jgi:uncharacterized UPF0160 family protein